ncbi:uncharacterized protein TNCT_334121 [Trichonephila clavata]|uniref:Uncharacterized protein n=1 Tax=Trichonephila clavata TaxID=2740835 RepID=A0A8X6GGN8_TRICU|nr:uncharacterized protein TNCT_334121 [Trichonephila clavata]
MAFLTKGKKEDLRKLAWEMGLSVGEDLRILDIKHLIVNSEKYEEASIKNLFTNIIEERLEKIKNDEQAAEQERKKAEQAEEEERKKAEQAEEEERKKAEQAADLERRKAEMDFELQKLKLQLEAKMSGVPQIKKTVNSKENSSKPYAPKRNSYDSRFDKTNQAGPTSSFNRGDKLKTDDRSDRPSVSCYGCGKPGVTKPRCPNCKPAVNKDSATFGNISLHSCSLTPNQSAVLKLAVNGIWGTACADSGASHSIAGETLYLLLQKEGANFQKTQITMSLADGHKSEVEVYTTSVVIRLEERVIRTQLIILPYAKGNRTLLGMDFLQKAGIVLNLKHRNWFFSDSPHRTYDFVKEAIIQEVQSRPNLEENTCLLRDDEDSMTISESEIGEVIFEILTQKNSAQKKLLGHSTDMIQSCIFNGIPKVGEEECMKILEYFYDPDYGNCYTIPPRNSKGETLEAREADFWQEANDLSLLIDVESNELLEKKRRPGIIVTVHDDSSAPDIHTDGHLLDPGRSYTFTIQKTSIQLLPLPYKTNCTDYYSLPWQKNSKRRHTSRLCTVGCSQYYQQKKCKFITKNLSLFFEELPFDPKQVSEKDKQCAAAEELRTQDYCRSICGLPCRDTIFGVTVGSTSLTEQEIYDHHIHSRINRTWEDKMQNLALLKIYFSTLEHTIYKHMPKYDTMELFSYLGGYSGVWLGFSLLTVYELVEILACTAQFAFQKHQRALQHRKVVRRIVNTKKHSKNFLKRRRFYK